MQFAAKTTGKSQEPPRNAETAPAISPRQRNRHPRFGAVAFACGSSSQKQDCPRTVHASINSISEAPAPSQRTGVETASNVLFECPGLTESRPHHHIGRTARTWATGSPAREAERRVDGCGCHARYGASGASTRTWANASEIELMDAGVVRGQPAAEPQPQSRTLLATRRTRS